MQQSKLLSNSARVCKLIGHRLTAVFHVFSNRWGCRITLLLVWCLLKAQKGIKAGAERSHDARACRDTSAFIQGDHAFARQVTRQEFQLSQAVSQPNNAM